jgi:dipeptidyl aminopeptidase/acylaminoacyl peptidase
VLEDHTNDTPAQVVNTLVSISKEDSTVHTLVSGSDFYASPRISPDGQYIAWVSWDHPSMPFFATQLWVAELKAGREGNTLEISNAKLIGKPGADEVSHHPVWTDDSTLVFSNDCTNFGNLYKVKVDAHARAGEGLTLSEAKMICQTPVSKEFIVPLWTLNASCFVLLGDGWLACTTVTKALTSLALLHVETGEFRELDTPFVVISQLRAVGNTGTVVFNGVMSNEPSAIVVMNLKPVLDGLTEIPRWGFVKRSSNAVEQGIVPRDYLTEAEVIEFPTELPSGEKTTAHAVIFPPRNPKYVAPAGTSPPCIVQIHGGPTAHANSGLNLSINYWTSRGYVVCVVNYGGSSGYGRDYMLRLEGQWGVVDVRDAVAASTYLGSPVGGAKRDKNRAERRISRIAQAEMASLHEKRLPSGAVEFALDNPSSWALTAWEAAISAAFLAAGALIPGLQAQYGVAAAALAWLYSKMTHVQRGKLTYDTKENGC